MGAVRKAKVQSRWVGEVARVAMGGERSVRAAASKVHPTITILAYMRIHGLTQSELAKRLGSNQPTVSLVLNGSVLPDSALRQAFQAVCWIPTAHWDRCW